MVSEQVRLSFLNRNVFLCPNVFARRAKARLLDGKHKGRSGSAEIPPDTPPELSTGFEADLHNLIHEDERTFWLNLSSLPFLPSHPSGYDYTVHRLVNRNLASHCNNRWKARPGCLCVRT